MQTIPPRQREWIFAVSGSEIELSATLSSASKRISRLLPSPRMRLKHKLAICGLTRCANDAPKTFDPALALAKEPKYRGWS
jgi:hypothetical protein